MLEELHTSHPETAPTTLYAAPLIFDRNANEVTPFTRLGDILWSGVSSSGLYSGSTIAPPTSVYSLPLILLDAVGGWDSDCESIGDDLHMFIKCFFTLNGNLNVQTILSPVSSTNANGNGGFLSGIHARYQQALRHMWGALDTGYFIRKVLQLLFVKNPRQRDRMCVPLHDRHPLDGARVSEEDILLLELESGVPKDAIPTTVPATCWRRVFYLGFRLLEVHFMPVQAIMVIALKIFLYVSGGEFPPHLSWVFRVCTWIATMNALQLPIYLLVYERYHKLCVSCREKEMARAGLGDRLQFAHRGWKNLVDYTVGPVVILLSGVLPSIQAQITHFWKLELNYRVSKKATKRNVTGKRAS